MVEVNYRRLVGACPSGGNNGEIRSNVCLDADHLPQMICVDDQLGVHGLHFCQQFLVLWVTALKMLGRNTHQRVCSAEHWCRTG